MRAFTCTFILFTLLILAPGCNYDTEHVDEQFGQGLYIPNQSAVVFYKGFSYYPDGWNYDSTQVQTKLSLYYYQPNQGNAFIIKNFDKIRNWPAAWESHLDYNKGVIGFSLSNTEKSRSTKQEGLYIYNIKTREAQKIEDKGSAFWISPDGNLVIYHLFDKETDSYHLYGYDIQTQKRSLYEENQPKIKNVEWLREGEAAILLTEKKDSTIIVEFK